MTEVTSGCTFYSSTLSSGLKELIITTANTADDGDTIVVTLKRYGISTLLSIFGCAHSTEDSIIVTEAPTTSVTTGTLTITIGGSTDNLKRVYVLRGI